MNRKNENLVGDSHNSNRSTSSEPGRNKKRRGIFIALIILSVMLIAATAFYFNKTEIEKLRQEQEQVLQKKFEESEKAREEFQESFKKSAEEISELNAKIESQAEEIEELTWKEGQYKEIKQRFDEINKKYVYLLGKSDSTELIAGKYAHLEDQNRKLLTQIKKYKKALDAQKRANKFLRERADTKVYVQEGNVSTLANFKATAFDVKTFYGEKNRKEKETNDKNKLNIIRIMFNLSESVPQHNFKDIILVAIIKDPKGEVVVKSTSAKTILIDDETEEKISIRTETKYRGPRKIFLSFIITDKKVTKLTKGAYTVKVYISQNNKIFHGLSSGGFNIK